ncbi:MAG TPA: phosphate acyltransferase PlsX [Solirubrobacterales bacterium]|nr:phosphate acyltransferase [Solirubrobacterales bacterium]HMU26833.1 phosphate acyltransferase PlsX [Solirubrobacterales bacterium]HMX71942.1 phosphate acyltransferase PlsX [Solirubrobacterales bacterium]HMY25299.1 phosphate acyltransferase PlsX [Solirubrobacterales bacterium]HNA23484.1 phosphate acyltransferase PlsX [Solirubrobacterales bacterium]
MDLSGTTVALDGLGVESGFDVLNEGIRLAAGDGIRLRVFGPADAIEVSGLPGVEVIDCTDQITNDDDPVPSVRSRPDSSIVRAVADVGAGNSESVVSLGSTGATMAASTFGLKRLKGVKRPALAAQVPLPGRTVLFLDIGANVEVRAQHLVQFAWLGAAFSKSVLGVERPEVGLLSVGEEAGKGREEVVEAHAALVGAGEFDFIGNVEGRDLPAGNADVIVTDGFTGNVVTKALEGTVKRVVGEISAAARKNPLSAAGGLLLKPALGGLRHDLHPDTTGGAILLGLRKTAVVGHGSSGSDGVANAIRLAARSARVDAPGLTEEMLHRVGVNRGSIDSATDV